VQISAVCLSKSQGLAHYHTICLITRVRNECSEWRCRGTASPYFFCMQQTRSLHGPKLFSPASSLLSPACLSNLISRPSPAHLFFKQAQPSPAHFANFTPATFPLPFLSAIGSPIIVTIWNVVFANKSRKLGWIWMKLGRWGWGLKRLSLARFQQNRAMGFRQSAKKWVAEVLFFVTCMTHHFCHFPWIDFCHFPQTRVQVLARNTWFHIPERFPLTGQIYQKKSF